MLHDVRQRASYANVTATIALFLALGGTSYAALTVTGKNVKNSSLTGADIKRSSLTTSDIKNRSLLAKDFKAGQLPTVAQGTQGPQGPRGETGPRGPSDMFTSFLETGSALQVRSSTDPPTFSTVATVNSDNGEFFVFSNLVARNTSSSTVIVRCEVTAFWTGDVVDSMLATLAPGAYAALALSGPGEQESSQAPRGFSLYCGANAESGAGGGEVGLSDLDFGAVQVGTWH